MNIAPELQGAAFALREIVGALLLVAAHSKFFDQTGFYRTLRGYDLLSDPLNRWVALLVPVFEFTLGVGLMLGAFTHIVVLATAGLLGAFTAWLILALTHGRKLDCGCFSRSAPTQLSWRLVSRNLLLIASLGIILSTAPLLSVDQLIFQGDETYAYASVAPGLILVSAVLSLFAIAASSDWLFEELFKEKR